MNNTTTILDLLPEDVAERLIALGDEEIDTAITVEYDLDVYDEASVLALAAEFNAGQAMSHEHVLEEIEDDDENRVDLELVAIEVNQHMAELKAADLASKAIVLEGEAMVSLPCAGGCGDEVTIDSTPLPDNHPDAGKPRVPTCVPCAKAETKDKQGVVVRRSRTQKHQPRLTCTPEELAAADSTRVSQEEPMLDLSKITDADLGAMVRAELLTTKAVPASQAAEDVKQATAKVQAKAEKKAKKASKTAKVAVVEVDADAATTRKVEALMSVKGWDKDRAVAWVASH